MEQSNEYKKGFIPYALAAFLIGIVGGFSTVLGPSFVQDIGIAYNNTTWTALAQAMSTAACAPILGKVGDVIGRKRTLLLGIAVFTLGNVLSALANSLVFMMIARFVVGIGTAVSGYAISVMYVGMSLGAVILGPLADRFEPKHVLTGSLILTGIGCGILFLFSEATSVLLLMASLGILGFGLGGNGTIFMKVALSGLPQQEAGAGTGTYGLFRDLAAPFGVAVFVPLFTNQITGLIAGGATGADAAVRSIHLLAIAELICIAAGIAAVLFLPRIRNKGASK